MLEHFAKAMAWIRKLRAEHDSVEPTIMGDHMRHLPWLMILMIPVLFMGTAAAWYSSGGMTAADFRPRNAIGWLDVMMVGVLLLGLLISWLAKTPLQDLLWRKVFVHTFQITFLIFGAACSIVDQWGRGTVTTFLLACIFLGALLFVRPLSAVFIYLLAYIVFWNGIGYTQLDPTKLTANRYMGFVAVALGLMLTVVLWRKQSAMVILQRKLEVLAQRDALTGLFNRREFARLASLELDRAKRYKSDTSVIMADLDFFKRINDTFGHPAGDDVIKFMASALRDGVRKTDVVARMGGEEFIVLLPETSMESARILAEKLRLWVQQTPVQVENQNAIPVTASFGVASVPVGQTATLESLYAAADAALYAAKTQGRNRVEACPVTSSP